MKDESTPNLVLLHPECADRGLIKIDFIRTEEQLGDIFTKSLAREKFEELRSKP